MAINIITLLLFIVWFIVPGLGISGDGQGVDVYIVDTGVYIEHADLVGRAEFGWFFLPIRISCHLFSSLLCLNLSYF